MSRIVGWLSKLILMPFGVIYLILGIHYLVSFNVLVAILSLLIGTFLLWFGAMEQSFELRRYSITSEGLCVGNRYKTFYAWNEIYEIGIFPFDAAASLQVYDRVICCSLSTPPANFKHKLFRNTGFYAQRNQNKFVIIDYDEATVNNLSNVYQKNIIDNTVGMNGHIRNGKR